MLASKRPLCAISSPTAITVRVDHKIADLPEIRGSSSCFEGCANELQAIGAEGFRIQFYKHLGVSSEMLRLFRFKGLLTLHEIQDSGSSEQSGEKQDDLARHKHIGRFMIIV